jgi:formylglycine-generating enzyme required for sulfatase activity
VDPRFAAIVDRCLRRDPAARYGSADELRESLEQLRPREREIVVPEGNPYRGLFAFEAEHRSLFFGRSNEIGTIIERLRTEAFILVAADSGIGKSSLCRAGVLPLIREGALGAGRQWQVQSLVPGRNLLESLCTVLSPILQSDVGQLAEQLLLDPTSLGRELHKHLSERDGLVLFIDQLEEVVTISDPAEVAAVGKALGHLVNRIPGVRMLMTARSDFLARIALVPGLGDELGHALYFLRPMPPAGIREAIVAPARAKGVHFESEAMIDMLVTETAQTDGGLPLLQFALTQLWDARTDGSITQRSMEAIGGVNGALARHADQVLLGLPSEQRLAARHVLMLLVTIEGTRARRTAEELGQGPAVRQAIEALVRGRLIVARDTGEGAVYEVAHEALLKGWVTLRHWLEEFAEHRAIRQRIEAAAAEWLRMHRAKDALWSSRQLAEAALIDEEDLTPKERSFLAASRQALQRGRLMRNAALLMIPLVLALFYGGIRYKHMRERDRAVAEHAGRGLALLDEARRRDAEVQALRSQAFLAFDSQKKEEGEALWARSLKLGAHSADSFAQASQALEAALLIDAGRADVRNLLADALYESALEAERARQPGRRAALVQRMALYDQGGVRQARLSAPAQLTIETSPPGARVRLQRYVEDDNQRRQLTGDRELGLTPLKGVSLPAGSYLLSFALPGRVPVRYPVLLRRAEELRVSFDLPAPREVPAGYVYVPPGRFLFGTASEEAIRQAFLSTVPLHEVASAPYLIGRTEVTYADWIEFLSALPKEERMQRSIRIPKGGMGGGVELREVEDRDRDGDGRWQLTLQLTTQVYTARTGEPIVYGHRKQRREHDWLKLPVAGISPQDTRAYAAWLDRSGRVPGARLCTDHEWERAARGADEREYPHGDLLAPQDANFDETYGKEQRSAGPDTVGSYPAGESPFGLLDMAGNVNEWVDSSLAPGEVAARSGGYFLGGIAARSTNRTTLDPDFRDPAMGARICASIPATR